MAKHALEKRLTKQEERIEALSEQQEISEQSLQQLRTKMKKMENSIRELEKQLSPIKNDSWKRRRSVAHGPTLGINTMNQGDGLLHGMASMPGQPESRPSLQPSNSESNVLLAFFENMQYAVALDTLHMVFSAVGTVQKIIIFNDGAVQALIQYPDVQTAVSAKETLEGHCIYDGGLCKLRIAYSHHNDLNIQANNDWSRDYTIPNIPVVNTQPSTMGQQPQPVQMMSHAAASYNGTQFAPTDQALMMPQSSAGWRPTVSAVPQSMPIQMHNQEYIMPPGTTPSGMGPGMMQNGAPQVTFPTYHGGPVQ